MFNNELGSILNVKKIHLVLFLVNFLSISEAQIVQSSCEAPDSIINLYLEDAKRLAVRKYPNSGILIPEDHYLPILNLLIAVYNAENLTARDLVIDTYKIHTFPRPVMHELLIKVDTSYSWVMKWKNGEQITGNPNIDSLMNMYDLELKDYYDWRIGQYVLIRAQDPLNLIPLAGQFNSIDGIIAANLNSVIGDGNDIELDGNRLIFSYGYGDCPSGCISRLYWIFEVYPDCSVSHVGGSSYPLLTVDAGKDTSICYGSSVTLNALVFYGSTPYTCIWNTGDSVPLITVKPTDSTKYSVKVIDADGIIANDVISINVYSLPSIDLGIDTSIFIDDLITLDAGSGYSSYMWNNDSTTQIITIKGSSVGIGTHTYSVIVTDTNNCSNFDEIKITVKDVTGYFKETEENEMIKVYPIPSDGIIKFDCISKSHTEISIQVISMEGKVILSKYYESIPFRFTESFNLSEFSKGIYFVKFLSDDFIEVIKVIVE